MYCNGASAPATNFTGPVTGATYNWTNNNISIGLGASGTGNISGFTATNGTATPYISTITIAPSFNGCSGAPSVFTITVNPTPTLTSSLTPQGICSSTTFSYTPTSATTGTIFTWIRAAVPGISNPASSGNDAISENLVNTTLNTIAVTYVYSLTANGCTNTQNVVVMVTQAPSLSSTTSAPAICSNTLFSYTPASNISGTTFTWTRAAVAGISNPARSGTGNPSESLINTTTNPLGVIYEYSLSSNGCTNLINFDVHVAVVPAPIVTANASSGSICPGTSITLSSTSSVAPGTPLSLSYNFNAGPGGWTSSNNSTGGTPANAAWTIEPNNYVTDGLTFNSDDATQFYLSNSRSQGGGTTRTETFLTSPVFSTVGITSLTLNFFHYFRYSGTTGEYARVEVSTDGIVWNPIALGTYTSTQGTSGAFAHPTIPLNGYVGYPAVRIRFHYYSPARARYWAIDNVSLNGVPVLTATINWGSNPAGYSSNVANPPASITPAVTTTYTVTYTDLLTNCSGSASATVIVNTIPTVNASPASQNACSGSAITPIVLTNPNNVPGTTYSWTRSANANLSGIGLTGTGSPITGTLVNTVNTVQSTTFTITASANGCSSTTTTAVVQVNPAPVVTNQNVTICSGAAFTVSPVNGAGIIIPAGTIYSWPAPVVTGGITGGSNQTGQSSISQTLVNPTTSIQTATYTVTPTSGAAGGCAGNPFTVTVTVNPRPAATLTANYCAVNGAVQLTAHPDPPGYTYSWNTGGNTQTINVNLAGTYTVTISNGLCSSTASLGVSQELVINGDFTAGNVGFTSAYTYKPDPYTGIPSSGLWPENTYNVYWDPQFSHSNFWGRDETSGTGNMMIVNGSGSNPPVVVWQEILPVTPNTDYYFSAWAMSMNNVGPFAQLRFNINGNQIGTTAVLPARATNNNPPYNWIQFYGNWTSPAGVTSATLQILDLQTALGGNDFALDEISFATFAQIPSTISPVTLLTGTNSCEGDELNLTANLSGGIPPYLFSWTGPNGFTSNLQNPSVLNITPANSGIYTLSMSDGYGCGNNIRTTPFITVYPKPAATISVPASVCLNAPQPVITFTGTAGTAPFTFLFNINGGSGTSATTTAGNSVTVPVPTNSAGSFTYNLLKVTDAFGCTNTQVSSATINIHSPPLCSFSGPASPICPSSIGNVYSGIAGASTYAWSITGNGSIAGAANAQSVTVNAGSLCNSSFRLTLTVSESHGCSSVCSQNIVVQDITSPSWITVSGSLNRTVLCSDAVGLAAAQVLQPTVNDNCTATLIPVKTPGSFIAGGSCPQSGTYTNTWTVSDACGNTVATPFTQVITIIDNVSPVWTTFAGALNRTIECSDNSGLLAAQAMVPGAVDNCDVNLTPVKVSGAFLPDISCPQRGTYTNTWTVSDACANTSSVYMQVITITDLTAPAWTTLPGALNRTLNCSDAAGVAAAQLLTPVASDNCDINVTGIVKTSGAFIPAVGCPQNGTYTNTWTATDHCGNTSAVYTQVITITDSSAPVWITSPAALNITLQCSDLAGLAAARALVPIASDNCDLTLIPVKTSGAFVQGSCPQAGTYTNTWTVSDDCGNVVSSPYTQIITIVDNSPPVWTTAAGSLNRTVVCSDAASLALAQSLQPGASDNCTATLIPVKTNGFFVPGATCPQAGTYTNTWTVSDACGNIAAAPYTQTITIIDNLAPVWTTAPNALNLTIECSNSAAIAAAQSLFPVAADNCDNNVTNLSKVSGVFVPTAGCAESGTYTNIWTVSDDCGNTSVAYTQIITLRDNTDPVINCPGNVSIDCDASTDPASTGTATAVDNCDPAPEITHTDVIINGLCPHAYSIQRTWRATDDCGNFSTCVQTISVNDVTSPILVGVPINVTVSCDNIPAVPVVTATDNCDPTLSVIYTETSNTVVEGCGSIVRTWTVADDCGNTSTRSQTITVRDNINPVLAGVPADVTVQCDNIPAAPTVTATDNCDPTLTVIFSQTLNTVIEGCGQIVRTWSVTDHCGNTTNSTQNITVIDTQPPIWITPTGSLNVSVACSDAAGLAIAQAMAPVANDNCDPSLTVIKTAGPYVPGSCPSRGTYTNTWSVSDNCGNIVTSVYIQIITITDNIPPVWNQAANTLNANLQCTDGAGLIAALAQAPTATDGCSSVVSVSLLSDNTLSGSCSGTFTRIRRWRASDDCGNINPIQFTQTINVYDNMPPVWDQAANAFNISLTCDDAVSLNNSLSLSPTATDACNSGVIISLISDEIIPGVCSGSYTRVRMWSAVDNCGNTSVAYTQTITVTDVQRPLLFNVPNNITISCGTAVPGNPGNVTAFDNCSDDVTSSIIYTPGIFIPSLSCPSGGTITHTWVANDGCGNYASASQAITIVDNIPPLWTTGSASLNVTIQCSDASALAVAQSLTPVATDNCGTTHLSIKNAGPYVPGICPNSGTYTNTWTATDDCGNNSSTFVQTITIQDTQSPVITVCPPDQTFCQVFGNTYNIPLLINGPDNCGTVNISFQITGATTRNGTGNNASGIFNTGVSTITWSAEDECHNISTCITTVRINPLPATSAIYHP